MNFAQPLSAKAQHASKIYTSSASKLTRNFYFLFLLDSFY